MTARDEASGYMEDAFQNNNEASWEQLLDAIPPTVKARLAIDEGGLTCVAYGRGSTREVTPNENWPTRWRGPLYRVVDP